MLAPQHTQFSPIISALSGPQERRFTRVANTAARGIVVLLIVVTLGACSTVSPFRSHPELVSELRQSLDQDTATPASSLLTSAAKNEALLYKLELGRIQQLNGQVTDSKASYAQAIQLFAEQDLKATVDLSDTAAQGLALVSNDKLLAYQGAGYERILLHHLQAQNYLAEGQLEGAAVELRRARLEQEVLAQVYAEEIASALALSAQENIDLEPVLAQLPGLESYAGKVKSAFQNAYTFYFSAVFWEAMGDWNSALVDYKKALEINPDNEHLLAAIKRSDAARRSAEDRARLVVFFEQGLAPAKQEQRIDVPHFDGGFISIALPTYNQVHNAPGPLQLTVHHSVPDVPSWFGETTILADIGAMAAKALLDDMPARVTRQVLRSISKYQLQRQLGESFGPGAQLLGNLYNLVSEQADLRSWLTLPNTVQATELNLSPGAQTLRLSVGDKTAELGLQVSAGSVVVLVVSDATADLIVRPYYLRTR